MFKLLPIREESDAGKSVFLKRYIDSLLIELEGALALYPPLEQNGHYVSILATVKYLSLHSDLPIERWRSETFRLIRLVDKSQRTDDCHAD
jgi:hypothetical protein